MAVANYDAGYVSKKTGLKPDDVRDILSAMGMPTESAEGGKIAVEVTPNRPDMLTVEGVIRALESYSKKRQFDYAAGKKAGYVMESSGSSSRPYAVCATVEGIKDRECFYEEIMEAQEKIHETLGRKRKKAAIGIHDLDSVKFPLRFREVKEGRFVPLGMDKEMGIGDMLERHEKGKAYAHLVEKGKYPVVEDANGIISVPPIINCDRTSVKESTRNFLIEITGTHKETLEHILNIFVCALVDRGGKAFSVKIGREAYPDLSRPELKIDAKEIAAISGVEMDAKGAEECLKRMNIAYKGGKALVPPYRKDASNKIDIIEDALIGFGYTNIVPSEPKFYTVGGRKMNVEREVMESMGFVEARNFYLCDASEYGRLLPGKKDGLLKIANPLTTEFDAVKNTTLIELLRSLGKNKMKSLPIRMFEHDHIYDGKEFVELGFVMADRQVSVEDGIATVKTLVGEKGVSVLFGGKPMFSDLYIGGWALAFSGKGFVGEVGVVKPEVLGSFGLDFPVVCGFVRQRDRTSAIRLCYIFRINHKSLYVF